MEGRGKTLSLTVVRQSEIRNDKRSQEGCDKIESSRVFVAAYGNARKFYCPHMHYLMVAGVLPNDAPGAGQHGTDGVLRPLIRLRPRHRSQPTAHRLPDIQEPW